MIYFGLVDWIFTVLLFLNWKRLRICVWCWSWLKFTWNRSCRVSDGRSGCIFRGSRGNFILEVEWEPCIVLFNHDTRQSCTKWQLDAHRCLITVPTNDQPTNVMTTLCIAVYALIKRCMPNALHTVYLVFVVTSCQPPSAEAVETFGPMHIPIATKGLHKNDSFSPQL